MSAAPKRSLFKKPAWATTAPVASSTPTDFYRHSDTVYQDIVAENERKRERRQARKAKVASSAKADDYTQVTKRRRLSQEDEVGSGRYTSDDSDAGASGDSEKEKAESPPKASQSSIGTRSRGPAKSPEPLPQVRASPRRAAPSLQQATIIDLGEESEDDSPPIVAQAPPIAVQEMSDDSESDEYVRELKRKAREKRQRELLEQARSSSTPDLTRPSSSNLTRGQTSNLQGSVEMGSATPPPPEDDPVCKILITSPLPGTTPLIVERRASQRLKEVRDFWCKKQGFDEAFSRTIFLTWRHHKLYDISTCKSLADKAKADSKKSRQQRSDFDDDIFSPTPDSPTGKPTSSTSTSFLERSKGQITVEAMTEESLLKAKFEAQRSKNHNHSHNTNDSSTAANTPSGNDSPSKPKEPDLRISLHSRNFEPLKLKVRPSTPVWKLMGAFKDQRVKPAIEAGQFTIAPVAATPNHEDDEEEEDTTGGGGERGTPGGVPDGEGEIEGKLKQITCTLMFDGEKLDPDSLMGDTEVEDTDTLDVIVR